MIQGEPADATEELVIQFVGAEGDVAQRTIRIASGTAMQANMINLPGAMTVQVNGTRCDGQFTIESDKRTDVVLRIGDSGCSVETKGTGPM